MSLRQLLMCGALLLCLAWPADAQFETGSITGTVQDKSGGVLPGVTVTLRNVDTNVSQVATTNDSGAYEFFTLRVGRYEIKAELSGFSTATVQDIALAIGRAGGAVIGAGLRSGKGRAFMAAAAPSGLSPMSLSMSCSSMARISVPPSMARLERMTASVPSCCRTMLSASRELLEKNRLMFMLDLQ